MQDPANIERRIIGAIADTIVTRTNLLPVAHVASGSTVVAGQAALPLDTVDGFAKQGYAQFFDNTGERVVSIASIDVDNKTLNLNYAHYADYGFTPGFASDHPAGGLIVSNLMLHESRKLDAMLATGRPVVQIWPVEHEAREWGMGTTMAPATIHIQVHASLALFDGAPMDVEAYSSHQQEMCWDAITQIEAALNNNRHLMAQYNSPGDHAQGLGDGKSPAFSKAIFAIVVSEKVAIPQAVAAMNVIVRPKKFVRSIP